MGRKGHKVKDVTGMQNIMFDLKPNRCEAEVFMTSDIDVTEFVKFMKKEKEKNPELTYFHGFVHIMGKLIYEYPKLNRFVQNRTLFEHDEVSIAFVAKAEFNDKSEEFMTCLPIGENDTVLDVSKNLKARIDKIRDKNSDANTAGANNVVDKLGHIWRPARSFLVGILKWWDCKFGLPGAIADENIYYSSLIVSSLPIGKQVMNSSLLSLNSALATNAIDTSSCSYRVLFCTNLFNFGNSYNVFPMISTNP